MSRFARGCGVDCHILEGEYVYGSGARCRFNADLDEFGFGFRFGEGGWNIVSAIKEMSWTVLPIFFIPMKNIKTQFRVLRVGLGLAGESGNAGDGDGDRPATGLYDAIDMYDVGRCTCAETCIGFKILSHEEREIRTHRWLKTCICSSFLIKGYPCKLCDGAGAGVGLGAVYRYRYPLIGGLGWRYRARCRWVDRSFPVEKGGGYLFQIHLHWGISCRMLESGCRCRFYASACGLCLYLAYAVVL